MIERLTWILASQPASADSARPARHHRPGRHADLVRRGPALRRDHAAPAWLRARADAGLERAGGVLRRGRLGVRRPGGADPPGRAQRGPDRRRAAARGSRCWPRSGAGPCNTRGRSRRQIAAHYDLGNRLFELFLDESMTYSCAVFEDEQADLGRGAAGQAALDLRAAGAGTRRSPARDRDRLGRSGGVRGGEPRLPRDHDDDLHRTGGRRARARGGGGPGGPDHRARVRLPRPRRAATRSSCRSR